jgi:sorbitol-specific phosphotransferase system component IIA
LGGENELIVGAGAVTVKVAGALDACPPGVVTVIGPVVAAEGTVAVICVSELTEYEEALTPLNATAVAPVNPVPVIVTEAPTGPLVGENELIIGAGGAVTVKTDGDVDAVPPGVVTAIGPVEADDGTVAVICESELKVNAALAPLNVTRKHR